MRKFLFIFLLLVLAFTSCEGRKNKAQAFTEDIEEFSKKVIIEIPIYEPEAYMERKIDTLFQNGYRVSINTFTDMNNTVLFTKIKDTINYQTYYRNFKFRILIEKHGKLIYDNTFDKNRINDLLNFNNLNASELKDFDELAILKSIELSKTQPLSEHIEIDIMYAIPNTNKISLHTLYINEEGLLNVERKPYN